MAAQIETWSLEKVSARCGEETSKFLNHATDCDDCFCNELFRRFACGSLPEGKLAKQELWQIYAPYANRLSLVRRWVKQLDKQSRIQGGRDEPLAEDDLSDIQLDAMQKFFKGFGCVQWNDAQQKYGLKSILSYWKTTTTNVFLDHQRKANQAIKFLPLDASQDEEAGDDDGLEMALPDTSVNVQAQVECDELRELLRLRALSHARPNQPTDQIILTAGFIQGMPARDIFASFRDVFESVNQVYEQLRRFRTLLQNDVRFCELLVLLKGCD